MNKDKTLSNMTETEFKTYVKEVIDKYLVNIRPKYKFLGFFVNTDDEQEECE